MCQRAKIEKKCDCGYMLRKKYKYYDYKKCPNCYKEVKC